MLYRLYILRRGEKGCFFEECQVYPSRLRGGRAEGNEPNAAQQKPSKKYRGNTKETQQVSEPSRVKPAAGRSFTEWSRAVRFWTAYKRIGFRGLRVGGYRFSKLPKIELNRGGRKDAGEQLSFEGGRPFAFGSLQRAKGQCWILMIRNSASTLTFGFKPTEATA